MSEDQSPYEPRQPVNQCGSVAASRALLKASFAPHLNDREADLVERAANAHGSAQMATVGPKRKKKGENGHRVAGNRPFLALLASMGLPAPVAEHRFHPTRKWRMDYAWPTQRVALEVDGGLFVNGGHNRGAQMKLTMEKENAAATMGWRFLKCEPRDLCKRETLEAIKAALAFQLF